MRGDERIQDRMFSNVSLERRVPVNHPLRAVRKFLGRRAAKRLARVPSGFGGTLKQPAHSKDAQKFEDAAPAMRQSMIPIHHGGGNDCV